MIHTRSTYYWHTNIDLLGVWEGRYGIYTYVLGHQIIYKIYFGRGGAVMTGTKICFTDNAGSGRGGQWRPIKYFTLLLQGNILYLYYVRFQIYIPPL